MKTFHGSKIAVLATALSFGIGEAYAADAPPAQAPAQNPRPAAAPGDLEPAVNTSATLPSSPPAAEPGKSAGSHAAAKPASTGTNAAQSAAAARSTAAAAARSTAAAGPQAARAAPRGKVMDRLNLDETQVTGNSELPKVLYIVPWKRPDPGDLNGKPMNSLLDEVLTPIDRDVFRRENRYYDALAAAQPGGTPGNPPAPGVKGTRDEK